MGFLYQRKRRKTYPVFEMWMVFNDQFEFKEVVRAYCYKW